MRVFGDTILLDATERGNFLRENYPGIVRAALEMSYCNGGINRERPEADMLADLWEIMVASQQEGSDLPVIDAWLKGLSEADLSTVVDGEETEMKALLKKAPPDTHAFLETVFDNAA